MHLLDPYGFGPLVPEESSDAAKQERAEAYTEEVELAQQAPAVEELVPAADIPSSQLDPALRLQDGLGAWIDRTEPAAGEPAAPEAGEPYAPLEDSGGQGI